MMPEEFDIERELRRALGPVDPPKDFSAQFAARRPVAVGLELAVVAAALPLSFASHRDGVIARPLWLGAATYDRGVGFSRTDGEITHHIDANVDAECPGQN